MVQVTTKIVLVGGMPRSGTTLLSRIIGERFQIPFSPETHYFTCAYVNGRLSPERLPKEITEDSRVAAAYSRIGECCRGVDTFRILLGEILGNEPIVGEKTPAHLVSFPEILKADSRVAAVVIKRDFFEVIESLRKVDWNNASFRSNLRRCVRYHRIAYVTQRQFPERICVVDYRKLCANEQRAISDLSKWLPCGEHSNVQEIFDPEVEPWKINALRAPEVFERQVTLQRVHLWIIAKLALIVSNILWPLKTIHS